MNIANRDDPWLPLIYRRPGEGGFAPWVANWREYSAGGPTRLWALWHVIVFRLLRRTFIGNLGRWANRVTARFQKMWD